ncbi:hypothetical protein ACMWJ0_16675, partial [Escherichia coli]
MKKLTVAISAVAASVLMAMSAQAAEIYNKDSNKLDLYGKVKEGANKQVISSQADSLIKISRIWADFFPANTSN